MNEAPVIFLDIDGVLVTRESLMAGGSACADRSCVAMLNKLLADTDAEIIITSSWRILHSLDFIRGALCARGFSYPNRIVDATGRESHMSVGGLHCSNVRADDIRAWLERNPRERYVIIDDDDDAEIEGHYVRTSMEHGGLGLGHVNIAKSILAPSSPVDKKEGE